jgi:transcription initiation factor TFIIIB Brf1 subunit/transcription initiation factor TFIIB
MATANVMHRPASPTTASSCSSLSRCPSPCVVWSATSRGAGGGSYSDDERYCRHCPSRTPLHTDWAQGDVVCTQCGVVDEERVLDDGPEWREFNDADDLAKGRPHQARSGMVPVDESLYVGGLQPTALSRGLYMGSNFGNSGRGSSATSASGIRKRLMAASRRIDRKMEKVSKEAIEGVRVNQQIQQRKRKRRRRGGTAPDSGANEYDDNEYLDDDEYSLGADSDPLLRPEYERLVLQEEEDTNRRKEALYADKWSLARAIRLYGNDHEVSLLVEGNHHQGNATTCGGDESSHHENLDSTLKQASHDLYRVYSMTLKATAALHLPDRVQGEAVELLCRYASRRDGLGVRGVSSASPSGSGGGGAASLAKKSPRQEREARAALTEYNKVKQAGALCSAVLFYSCRRMGHARPVEEVCSSIRPTTSDCDNPHVKAGLEVVGGNSPNHKTSFITKKHCAKAMKEVKDLFPEVAVVNPAAVTPPTSKSVPAADPEANSVSKTLASLDVISNAIDNRIRTLHLPPVAQAMVRSLVLLLAVEEFDSMATPATGTAATVPLSSSKHLPTLCGAVAVLVCHAGAVMQRLAAQARPPPNPKQERRGSISESTGNTPDLQHYSDPADSPATAESATHLLQSCEDEAGGGGLEVSDGDGDGDALSSEQRAYEMGRIWDAWSSQTPWFRSVPHIEQSVRAGGGAGAGGSGSILARYRKHVFPRRHSLLRHVACAAAGSHRDPVPATVMAATAMAPAAPASSCTAKSIAEQVAESTLRDAPLSSVLLPQLPLVAPMLNEDARTER